MTVELMLTPAFFAHFSMILMLDSIIGCPPWQMVSVSAACAGVASAPSANIAAASGRYPRIPRALVICVPPDRWSWLRASGAGIPTIPQAAIVYNIVFWIVYNLDLG